MPDWAFGRSSPGAARVKLYTVKFPRKSIFISAALALACAPSLFAAPPAYKEAVSPWTLEQADKLPPAMTPEFLGAVAAEHGPAAAEKLAEKRDKVSGLLRRYRVCDLRAGDAEAAEKYFTRELAAEVRYFAAGGCEAFKEVAGRAEKPAAAPKGGPAAAAARLENLEAAALSGELATREGAARFFDGSVSRGGAALPAVYAGAPAASPGAAAASRPAARPLASRVPAVVSEPFRAANSVQRPDEVGYGRVNQAVDFWAKMRKEGWQAYRSGDLSGGEKAEALGKAAAGAVFGALLFYSNLPAVEKAGARLRYDIKHDQSGKVIAADAAKLAFQSGVTLLALAPIPMLKVAKAALAGEAWAIALLAAFAAGPVNRVTHFAD